MRLLIFLFPFIVVSASAKPITNNRQLTCSQKIKCLIQPSGAKIKPVLVSFVEREQDQKKTILSVQFSYPNGKMASNNVKSMEPVLSNEPYEFRYVDLNGDKYKDLALRTERGTHINHYQYWLYSTVMGTYIPLGIYPELSYNSKLKKLQTLSRHSSLPSKTFKLEKDKLIEVR